MLLINQSSYPSFNKFGSIKITSPDQFVPLYVALEAPFNTRNLNGIGKYNFWDTSNVKHCNLNREEMRSMLIEQLNHSYPNEYYFCLNTGISAYGSWANHNQRSLATRFLREECTTYSNAQLRFGLIMQGQINRQYSTIKTNSLYQAMNLTVGYLRDLSCTALIVVKAKYIPKIRARLYLEMPLDLPVGAIRVLKSSNTDLNRLILSSSEVSGYLQRQEIMVEDVNKDEIMKYIIPNFSEVLKAPIENVIKSSLDIIKQEELELV